MEFSNGLSTLSSNSASLNQGAEQVFAPLLSTAETQIKAAGIEIPSLTIQNYGKVLKGVIDSLDKDAVYEKALQQVTAAVEAKRPENIQTTVKQQTEAQVQKAIAEQMGSDTVKAQLAAVSEGAKTMKQLRDGSMALSDEMDGQVKFIYRTDEIKEE